MFSEVVKIIVAILGSSVLTTIVNNWFQKRKNDAETNSIVVQQYQDLVGVLTSEIDRLKKRVDDLYDVDKKHFEERIELKSRIEYLEKDNKTLHEENKRLKEKLNKLKP